MTDFLNPAKKSLALFLTWSLMNLASLSVFCPVAAAEEAAPAAEESALLNEITIRSNTVTLKTSKPASYNVFKVGSPARLVVELSNTRNNWKKKEVTLKNNRYFSRIRAGQFQEEPVKIARVVMDLKASIDYEAKSDGNAIILTAKLGAPEAEPASATDPDATLPMAAAPTPAEFAQTEAAPAATETQAAAEVMPVAKPEAKKPSPINTADPASLFGKQPVTLDFFDIPVIDLFKILSEKAGVNVVYGSDVTGNVSIQLRDVPFDDAVNTVLTLKNLRMLALGKNIVQVITPTEFDKYKTNAISATKVFPINYAKASDVNTQLISIQATLGGKGKSLVDDRTNSIIVTDTPEGIESTAKLILDLDKPTPQVMIEAKIVEVSLGKNLDLGIAWGNTYTDKSGNQIFTIGATQAQRTIFKGNDDTLETPGSGAALDPLMTRSPLTPGGVADLEATGTGFSAAQGLGLSFGFVKDVVRLNAQLNALAQKNKSKVLSNPKIATLNNQAATIKSQISEPYITNQTQLTNAGSLTTQVVNQALSGITLTVTPTINADGRITMKIVPDITDSQPTAIGVPKTTSQQANTTVIVRDGETFVIGGLIRENESDSKAYVPILGSIPIIGHLFKKTSNSKRRSELLVFVTPKIIPY